MEILNEMLKEKNRVQEELAKESNYNIKDMLEKAVKNTQQLAKENKITIHYYK